MDQEETELLPELSFEDLLDDTPAKKRYGASQSDSDPLELNDIIDTAKATDDSLNTPKVKKYSSQADQEPAAEQQLVELAPDQPEDPLSIGVAAAPLSPGTRALLGDSVTTATVMGKPILLNGKNILPQTAGKKFIKIAPRPPGTTTAAPATPTTMKVVKAGAAPAKTAVQVATSQAALTAVASTDGPSTSAVGAGQIIYIKKSTGASPVAGGKFVVQRANGKQFIVTNPNMIKLAGTSKSPITLGTASGVATATLAAKPVVTTMAGKPVTSPIVSATAVKVAHHSPVGAKVVASPMVSKIGAATIVTKTVAQSITTKPVAQSITTKPVAQSITTKPVVQSVATKPVVQAIATKPEAQSITTKPVVQSIATKPVTSAIVTKTVTHSITPRSAASTITTKTVAHAITPRPVASTVAGKPVASSSATVLPATTATSSAPATRSPETPLKEAPTTTASASPGGTPMILSKSEASGTLTLSTKTPPTSTISTLSSVGVRGTPAIISKSGKILLNGKEYIMKANHKLIKLAPAATTSSPSASNTTTSTTPSTATSSINTSTTSPSAPAASQQAQARVHAIPMGSGKQVQVVQNANGKPIVMSNIVRVVNLNQAASSTAAAATATSATVTAATASPQTPSTITVRSGPQVGASQVKILKGMPHKLTLTLSPKLAKTAITRASPSEQPSSSSSATSSDQASLSLGKRKITEINQELKRVTAAGNESGDTPTPEIKKTANGSRIVVVPRMMLKSNVTFSTAATSPAASATSAVSTMQIDRSALAQQVAAAVKKSDKKAAAAAGADTSKTSTAAVPSYNIVKSPRRLFTILKPNSTEEEEPKPAPKQKTAADLVLGNLAAAAASSDTSPPPPKVSKTPKESSQSQAPAEASSDAAAKDPLDELEMKLKGSIVRRKHCNCSKSQCLKLYCDCFANGEFCYNCTCKDCFNNLQYEDERQRAIKSCLERNPSAFKPKITAANDDMRSHNKGCNCKRSGCLKNYCECYEAKIPCSSNCKCVGCRNAEEGPDWDMDPREEKPGHLSARAGQKRSHYSRDQSDYSLQNGTDDSNHSRSADSPTEQLTEGSTGDGHRGNFITQDVIDATVQCMFSQADECIKSDLPDYQSERMVMEEMGRCLVEIIDFSIRNADKSFTQE